MNLMHDESNDLFSEKKFLSELSLDSSFLKLSDSASVFQSSPDPYVEDRKDNDSVSINFTMNAESAAPLSFDQGNTEEQQDEAENEDVKEDNSDNYKISGKVKRKYNKAKRKQRTTESEQERKAKRIENNRKAAQASRERKQLYIQHLENEVMLRLIKR